MDTTRPASSDTATLRCLFEALSGPASEAQTKGAASDFAKPVRKSATAPANESVQFLILSTQRVIRHYRHLLARQPISEAERNVIHERIQREERVLRGLLETHGDPSSTGRPYAVAA